MVDTWSQQVLLYGVALLVVLAVGVGYLFYRRQVERRLATQAITQSRDLLMAIIDTAPMRVFWKDRNLHYLGCNTAFARDAGLASPQEVIGKDDYQMGWAEQAEAYRADDLAVMASGLPRLFYDEPQTTPDGRTIWLRTSKVPLKNRDHNIIGILGLYEDITERVQSDQAKAEALEHLQKIASRVPGLVYQYRLRPNGSSCLPFASEAIRDLFRVGPDDVRDDASALVAAVHADDREAFWQSIQTSARELAPWQHEFRTRFADGTVRWLLGNAVPERDNDGSTLWHGFVTDITERRKAEEALRKLSTAVEQSPASVVITNLDATIEYVNPQFSRVSGYSAAEAIGQNPRILQSKQTSPDTYRDMWATLSGGQAWHGELVNKRKNGELYWEESHIAPVKDTQGQITHYVAIKTDVTQRTAAENALIQSEARIKGVLEGAADAIFITDQQGVFQYVNGQAATMLGYSLEELMRLSERDLIPEEDVPMVLAQLQQLVMTGVLRCELRLRSKGGGIIPVDFNGTVLPDGSVFGSCRDISERKKTEKLLTESEAHLKAIIENEPECIKVVNAQGQLVQMNPAGLQMIEADSFAQVERAPVLDVIAPEYREAFAEMHRRVIAGETVQLEYEVIGLKGGRRWLETHAVPMQVQGETVHLAVTRDITPRKKMEDQVRQLAFHDPLTNLPNRRLLLDRLSLTMAASKRSTFYAAMMFLDLDNFKPLNDMHGHGVGDLLLVEVARRLSACVREVDTVARLGGDEFVVMLSELAHDRETSTQQALVVAEKIRQALSQTYRLVISPDGQQVVEHHCTASIGLVVFINHEANRDDLLKHADMAMYQAKDAGRNAIRLYAEVPPPP